MRSAGTERLRRLALVAGGLVLISLVGYAVCLAQRPPDGPEPVAWDREACAHCRMHVGDPRFAAQLQTASGETRNYDDPGCLLADLAERRREGVRAIWLRDANADRWLPAAEAVFVPASPTPMGYGLAAVTKGSPGAAGGLDLDAAMQRIATPPVVEDRR